MPGTLSDIEELSSTALIWYGAPFCSLQPLGLDGSSCITESQLQPGPNQQVTTQLQDAPFACNTQKLLIIFSSTAPNLTEFGNPSTPCQKSLPLLLTAARTWSSLSLSLAIFCKIAKQGIGTALISTNSLLWKARNSQVHQGHNP